jgi:antitoxin FitA
MAQLLVRNVPDEVVRALKLRAAVNGVSAEEEHRRILAEAMMEAEKKANELRTKGLLNISEVGGTDDADDWMFDRNDPRNARPPRRDQLAAYDFKAHLSALSEVEGDVSFDRPRGTSNRPAPEL